MRCPKCHYISFDSGDRCRNCGYDFSLTVVNGPGRSDLPIASPDAPEGPLADFALETARPAPPRAPDTAGDLPLFARGNPAERALMAPAAAPRAPLAVRRSNPAGVRERARVPDEPTLDLGAPEPPPGRRDGLLASEEGGTTDTAPILPRIAAALIDAILIVSIDAAVIFLTLRLCGLTFDELRLLPPVPLGAFLLLLAGGYVVSFTVAGGQTIGKMAAKIRVVSVGADETRAARLTLASALLRATGCLVSILTAGLGYIPALVSQDHRALHDRLAHTRVVRA